MTKLLIVNSSAGGDASVSSRLTAEYAARLEARDPSLQVTVRDVGRDPIPHLDAGSVGGLRAGHDTEAGRRARSLSDSLISEVEQADLIVIGAPMYNFGIASTLKAWFDHVLRAGITFRYGPSGPEGLVADKPVIVIETRGGTYSEGPAAAMDSQEPHLRTMLGFIGLRNVTFVRAEGLTSAEAIAAAVERVAAELDELAQAELKLAA